ncbi:unnamed protein product [Lactuca virosa]|uniref:Uncharacterized protein n=1 Tax=Lactuca virosa TaxID=75947 RepID=A0AAU9M0D2_9ASTR|nr:unnamed protein product [Lactuca virosa]
MDDSKIKNSNSSSRAANPTLGICCLHVTGCSLELWGFLQLATVLPPTTNILDAYLNGSSDEQVIIGFNKKCIHSEFGIVFHFILQVSYPCTGIHTREHCCTFNGP